MQPPAESASEIRDFLLVRQERRALFPRALLVGVLAGAMAVAFRIALAAADGARAAVIGWGHALPHGGWLLPVLWGAAGAALSVLLVRRFAPETTGSGIPHLEAVLHRLREMRPARVIPVKFIGGVLALGSGLALGREGPTVQLGGAVGAAVADRIGRGQRDRQTLIAAGAGAGLAAAFNAPLAGLIFVLEEVQRDFRPLVFGAAFLAAAAANVLAQWASGPFPVFEVSSFPLQPLVLLPGFALVGVLCGVLGVAFNRALLVTLDAFARVKHRVALAALVGALVGLVAWRTPLAVGGGHSMAETILSGQIALGAIPLWFALRFWLTVGSYGTGAPGGIFAPLLVLGALTGLAVGQAAHGLWPALVPHPGAFAVVGMAAYFAAVVRAPLTGLVLIAEMTGGYALMLPLLVACILAYLVADALGTPPIYEALLERDLARTGATGAAQPIVVEVEVQPGAPFAGRAVKSLGLPRGCVLVNVREGGHEFIPHADTVLAPHQRLTAVIAPEAAGALDLLRAGVGLPAGHEGERGDRRD